jgi:predicted metal-binding protein
MEQKTQFEQWKELALACGFTSAWMLDTETLVFRPEVRAMCADDKCHSFGKCWTCPPACGTIEEAAEKASAFHRGILVQTVAQLEDCFDSEGIEEADGATRRALTACCSACDRKG